MHLPSPDHTIVTFAGADALSFLQSQLTNDVAAMAVGGWQWQGYCSAKGRLQATFAMARTDDDAFAAVVHNSVAAAFAKRNAGLIVTLAKAGAHARCTSLNLPTAGIPAFASITTI